MSGSLNKGSTVNLPAGPAQLKTSISKQGVLTAMLPADTPDITASVIKINIKERQNTSLYQYKNE
jgi:hypothetical protein